MIMRVIAGVLFSIVLLFQDSREGHMLILLDLPAVAVCALSQLVFGVPRALSNAFDPSYLICSLIGWLLLALMLGGAAGAAMRRRNAAATSR